MKILFIILLSAFMFCSVNAEMGSADLNDTLKAHLSLGESGWGITIDSVLSKPTLPMKIDTIRVEVTGQKIDSVKYHAFDGGDFNLNCTMAPTYSGTIVYTEECVEPGHYLYKQIFTPIIKTTIDTTYYLTPEQVEILLLIENLTKGKNE